MIYPCYLFILMGDSYVAVDEIGAYRNNGSRGCIRSLSLPSFDSRLFLSLIHPTVTHVTLWSGSSDLWFFNRSIAPVYLFCSVPIHTLFPLVPLLSASFPLTQSMTLHHDPVLFSRILPHTSPDLWLSLGVISSPLRGTDLNTVPNTPFTG